MVMANTFVASVSVPAEAVSGVFGVKRSHREREVALVTASFRIDSG